MIGGRRAGVVMLCWALLVGACSGGADVPTATVPTAPATPTTVDLYAVPAAIDAAYVNRVLAGLDAAKAEILRIVMRDRRITAEIGDRIAALYAGRDLKQLQLDSYRETLNDDFVGLQKSPGPVKTVVTELISALPNCIFVKVDTDPSAVATQPDPKLRTQWVGLTRGSAPSPFNPTPWNLTTEGFNRNLSAPDNPCANP